MSHAHARTRITAEEFVAWSLDQPEGRRYELEGGEVIQMASERTRHNLMKTLVVVRLREAAHAAGLRCQVFSDGMAVRVGPDSVYEPDAALRVGEKLGPDVVIYDDPLIVVEVVSPSSKGIDSSTKLKRYFTLPSLRHYLIVDTEDERLVHHGRASTDGDIRTAIQPLSAPLRLDPPGLTLVNLVEN